MTKILLLCSFLSFSVLAEEKKEVKFEEKKAEILKQIDGKIANINEARSCIANSKGMDDLKACREKSKKKLEDLRSKRKANRPK